MPTLAMDQASKSIPSSLRKILDKESVLTTIVQEKLKSSSIKDYDFTGYIGMANAKFKEDFLPYYLALKVALEQEDEAKASVLLDLPVIKNNLELNNLELIRIAAITKNEKIIEKCRQVSSKAEQFKFIDDQTIKDNIGNIVIENKGNEDDFLYKKLPLTTHQLVESLLMIKIIEAEDNKKNSLGSAFVKYYCAIVKRSLKENSIFTDEYNETTGKSFNVVLVRYQDNYKELCRQLNLKHLEQVKKDKEYMEKKRKESQKNKSLNPEGPSCETDKPEQNNKEECNLTDDDKLWAKHVRTFKAFDYQYAEKNWDNNYKHRLFKEIFQGGPFSQAQTKRQLLDLLHLCATPQGNYCIFTRSYGDTDSFKELVKLICKEPDLIKLLGLQLERANYNSNKGFESAVKTLLLDDIKSNQNYCLGQNDTIDKIRLKKDDNQNIIFEKVENESWCSCLLTR